jgi:hypothetical protein
MSWCNTAGVPQINSFAEAKARFENTKPIRGNKDKVRPLGYRNKWSMARMEMPDADTVVFLYYGEPFVTWKPDDSFTVTNNTYQSPWVAGHLPFFLPRRWETKWNGCRMTIGNKGKFYLMPAGTTFQFVKAGDDYELVNKPIAHAIRKKRGADRAILAKCAPFFDWLTVVSTVNNCLTATETKDAMDKLREHVGLRTAEWYRERLQESYKPESILTPTERSKIYDDYRMVDTVPTTISQYTHVRYRAFHTPSSELLMNWVESDNADNWVLAMYVLAERSGVRRYNSGDMQFKLTLESATKYLTEVARHVYRDSIFTTEQLDDGVVPSRSNAVYFRSHAFNL